MKKLILGLAILTCLVSSADAAPDPCSQSNWKWEGGRCANNAGNLYFTLQNRCGTDKDWEKCKQWAKLGKNNKDYNKFVDVYPQEKIIWLRTECKGLYTDLPNPK
jgi:hypothetical protein